VVVLAWHSDEELQIRMITTLRAAPTLNTVLILVMGVGVVGLFANLIAHILNPSTVMIQPSRVEAIVVLELIGMAISLPSGSYSLRLDVKASRPVS
jgi:threonine dehydrogenase-like Zn-dependent dehydrogenase